jgi:hypothetical protein
MHNANHDQQCESEEISIGLCIVRITCDQDGQLEGVVLNANPRLI